mgnify:CR=1 FL=1
MLSEPLSGDMSAVISSESESDTFLDESELDERGYFCMVSCAARALVRFCRTVPVFLRICI